MEATATDKDTTSYTIQFFENKEITEGIEDHWIKMLMRIVKSVLQHVQEDVEQYEQDVVHWAYEYLLCELRKPPELQEVGKIGSRVFKQTMNRATEQSKVGLSEIYRPMYVSVCPLDDEPSEYQLRRYPALKYTIADSCAQEQLSFPDFCDKYTTLLSENELIIVWLNVVENWTIRRIAIELDIPDAEIGEMKYRALRKLRQSES